MSDKPFFNPRNHTEESLIIRAKIRKKQIAEIKKELGLPDKDIPDFMKLAKSLGCEDFAKKLEYERKIRSS